MRSPGPIDFQRSSRSGILVSSVADGKHRRDPPRESLWPTDWDPGSRVASVCRSALQNDRRLRRADANLILPESEPRSHPQNGEMIQPSTSDDNQVGWVEALREPTVDGSDPQEAQAKQFEQAPHKIPHGHDDNQVNSRFYPPPPQPALAPQCEAAFKGKQQDNMDRYRPADESRTRIGLGVVPNRAIYPSKQGQSRPRPSHTGSGRTARSECGTGSAPGFHGNPFHSCSAVPSGVAWIQARTGPGMQ